MKKLFNTIPIMLFLAIVMLVSCTEEIDVNLNASDPQIVIEGKVANNDETSQIKITKSVNFDESNNFPTVQNASVKLSDEFGNSEVLTQSSPGIYTTNTLTGIPNVTYYLEVEVEGELFTSSCRIPNQVSFDSLNVSETTGPIGGEYTTNYEVTVFYSDPEYEENYYRFVERVNGEIIDSHIYDDRLNNGQKAEIKLLSFDRNLETGDTLQVEMQCIDKSVYEYFNSFSNLQGGPGGSATPANPYTNIEGAVLGYFSAYTSAIKEKVIQ